VDGALDIAPPCRQSGAATGRADCEAVVNVVKETLARSIKLAADDSDFPMFPEFFALNTIRQQSDLLA
jgi:hypothetical protein